MSALRERASSLDDEHDYELRLRITNYEHEKKLLTLNSYLLSVHCSLFTVNHLSNHRRTSSYQNSELLGLSTQ